LLELAGEFIGANTAARQQVLRLELPLLEALLLGRMSGDLPRPTAQDLRLQQHPPYGGPGYGYGPGPYPDSVIVNPVTGRWCRTESNGYQFCWTP
jgi:hypothetical protein